MNEPGPEPDLSFPKGMSAYVKTRLQLASIETQEALAHLKHKLGPIVVILVCAVASYFLLLTALVSFLGKLLGLLGKSPFLGWELAALLVAGIHILSHLPDEGKNHQQAPSSFRILPSRTRTRPRMDSRTQADKQELVSRAGRLSQHSQGARHPPDSLAVQEPCPRHGQAALHHAGASRAHRS